MISLRDEYDYWNNKPFLLADAGGSTTQWAFYNPAEDALERFYTLGINPHIDSAQTIQTLLSSYPLKAWIAKAKTIHFYGAGLSTEEKKRELTKIFLDLSHTQPKVMCMPDTELCIQVHSGQAPFTSVILGTGCSAVYVSEKNQREIFQPSLGYLLGDAGSGAYFGKKLLQHWLLGKLESEISQRFENQFGVDASQAIAKVYAHPRPNAYLAEFFPFVQTEKTHPQIKEIIQNGFTELILEVLKKYPNKTPFHFCGSVAYLLQDNLRETLNQHQLIMGNVIKEPLESYLSILGITGKDK
jgi:glucosamine kinase